MTSFRRSDLKIDVFAIQKNRIDYLSPSMLLMHDTSLSLAIREADKPNPTHSLSLWKILHIHPSIKKYIGSDRPICYYNTFYNYISYIKRLNLKQPHPKYDFDNENSITGSTAAANHHRHDDNNNNNGSWLPNN